MIRPQMIRHSRPHVNRLLPSGKGLGGLCTSETPSPLGPASPITDATICSYGATKRFSRRRRPPRPATTVAQSRRPSLCGRGHRDLPSSAVQGIMLIGPT
jgi:hypothetical protein